MTTPVTTTRLTVNNQLATSTRSLYCGNASNSTRATNFIFFNSGNSTTPSLQILNINSSTILPSTTFKSNMFFTDPTRFPVNTTFASMVFSNTTPCTFNINDTSGGAIFRARTSATGVPAGVSIGNFATGTTSVFSVKGSWSFSTDAVGDPLQLFGNATSGVICNDTFRANVSLVTPVIAAATNSLCISAAGSTGSVSLITGGLSIRNNVDGTDADCGLGLRGSMSISNNLDVAGNIVVTGNLTAGTLSFGNVSADNMSITGLLSVGNLAVENNATVNGNLAVENDATMHANLSVAGTTNLGDTFGQTMHISDTLTALTGTFTNTHDHSSIVLDANDATSNITLTDATYGTNTVVVSGQVPSLVMTPLGNSTRTVALNGATSSFTLYDPLSGNATIGMNGITGLVTLSNAGNSTPMVGLNGTSGICDMTGLTAQSVTLSVPDNSSQINMSAFTGEISFTDSSGNSTIVIDGEEDSITVGTLHVSTLDIGNTTFENLSVDNLNVSGNTSLAGQTILPSGAQFVASNGSTVTLNPTTTFSVQGDATFSGTTTIGGQLVPLNSTISLGNSSNVWDTSFVKTIDPTSSNNHLYVNRRMPVFFADNAGDSLDEGVLFRYGASPTYRGLYWNEAGSTWRLASGISSLPSTIITSGTLDSLEVQNVNASTAFFDGDVSINGTLSVQRVIQADTIITLHASQVEVSDPNIHLAVGSVGHIYDLGVYGEYYESLSSSTPLYNGYFWSATDHKFHFYTNLSVEPGNTVNTSAAGYTEADGVFGALEATSASLVSSTTGTVLTVQALASTDNAIDVPVGSIVVSSGGIEASNAGALAASFTRSDTDGPVMHVGAASSAAVAINVPVGTVQLGSGALSISSSSSGVPTLSLTADASTTNAINVTRGGINVNTGNVTMASGSLNVAASAGAALTLLRSTSGTVASITASTSASDALAVVTGGINVASGSVAVSRDSAIAVNVTRTGSLGDALVINGYSSNSNALHATLGGIALDSGNMTLSSGSINVATGNATALTVARSGTSGAVISATAVASTDAALHAPIGGIRLDNGNSTFSSNNTVLSVSQTGGSAAAVLLSAADEVTPALRITRGTFVLDGAFTPNLISSPALTVNITASGGILLANRNAYILTGSARSCNAPDYSSYTTSNILVSITNTTGGSIPAGAGPTDVYKLNGNTPLGNGETLVVYWIGAAGAYIRLLTAPAPS